MLLSKLPKTLCSTYNVYTVFALEKKTKLLFQKDRKPIEKALPNLPCTQKINLDFEKKVAAASCSSLTTVVSSEISEKIKAIKAKLILLKKEF